MNPDLNIDERDGQDMPASTFACSDQDLGLSARQPTSRAVLYPFHPVYQCSNKRHHLSVSVAAFRAVDSVAFFESWFSHGGTENTESECWEVMHAW